MCTRNFNFTVLSQYFRFLHPGVTDKGNYNMFDVVRGMPTTGSFPPPRDSAPPESAWERGLRTAKEVWPLFLELRRNKLILCKHDLYA